jgi:hypothetical protein
VIRGTQVARRNHYVPQSYLRRWSADGLGIHAYRTLVPTEAYPSWELRSIDHVAVRRDLYTSVAEGIDSDRIERWLNQEVETPGELVLQSLTRGESLRRSDRVALARYIAALDARGIVAERAHRWIFSQEPTPRASWFRRRHVDLDTFTSEERAWAEFHATQTAATQSPAATGREIPGQ